MLQPELEAQRSYHLPTSPTIPFLSASSDQSFTKPHHATPHRNTGPDLHSDPHIVIPLARSPQPEAPLRRKLRKRGLVLTEQGWQKLLQAGVIQNQFGERYTFAELSERTLLDPRTVCRILGREEAVDKRSLSIFFVAFRLQLERDDYMTPQAEIDTGREQNAASSPDFLSATSCNHPRAEEIATIRRRIVADCCQLLLLLGDYQKS